MILGIHHIAVHTSDLDRLAAFYVAAFGFTAVGDEVNLKDLPAAAAVTGVEGAAARVVMLKAGTCFIEMFEWSAPKGRPLRPLRPQDFGYTHFSVAVADIEHEWKRLSELGMTFATRGASACRRHRVGVWQRPRREHHRNQRIFRRPSTRARVGRSEATRRSGSITTRGHDSMTGRLEGKVCLVTGAARGQGRSHAIGLATEGADIIAFDLAGPIETVPYDLGTSADLDQTVREVEALGRRIVASEVDVRDYSALKSALDDGVNELGGLDVACANAGILSVSPPRGHG